MRKVIIVNAQGEIIKEYRSARNAAADIQIDFRLLHHILAGNHLQPCQRPFLNRKTGHELADHNLVVYDDVFSLHSEKILAAYNGQLPVHLVIKGIDQKAVVDALTDEKTKILRAKLRENSRLWRARQRENKEN